MRKYLLSAFCLRLYKMILPSIVLASGSAFAMECNSRLIHIGASMSEVYNICGEPDDEWNTREIRFIELRTPIGDPKKGDATITQTTGREVLIQRWTYNWGPNRFQRILTFEDGHLRAIRIGNYGNKEN
jgi:hypothetical protein